MNEKPATEQFLAGGGETGALMRSMDWTKTSLGDPKGWPLSLKTCVRIILTSRQPMFVWWGKELVNLYNDPYRAILGGKHPWALGRPASEVWHEIWDEAGPRAMTAMEKNEGTYDEALLLIMERNGYPEETYYTFSYSPVPNDQGVTSGIICANTDDTQRIVSERQMHTLRDLGKKMIDSKSNSDIFSKSLAVLEQNTHDFPYAFLYEVNASGDTALMAGRTTADISADMTPPIIFLNTDTGLQGAITRTVQDRKINIADRLTEQYGPLPAGAWRQSPDRAIVIPIIPSGQRFPQVVLVAGLNPYHQLDDQYMSFFQLVADQIASSIANVHAYEEERRRAEALAEIDRSKTDFFSNVSHEFRTPLTLMLGPLEELLSQPQEPEARQSLEAAHRNAMRLLKLVNTLLDFSRIEAGRMQAVFRPIDLAMYTKGLSSAFRSVIEKAGMRFEMDCAPLSQVVYIDKEMWEKIVFNLLSNAFKYTLQGMIRVTLREENDRVILQVMDTGVGIPEAELPRMFERFHRVPRIGRTHEGTGIGLSLVRELAILHGGYVSVQSREGQGSTFTVAIPLGKEHLPSTQVSNRIDDGYDVALADLYLKEISGLGHDVKSEGPAPGTDSDAASEDGNGMYTVLVVDDNMDMRDYIGRLLMRHYRVETAANGKEALEKIPLVQPTLIISDIMMPVMDGIEMLNSIRRDPVRGRTPVILLSARAGEEAKIQGYDLGADDYLVKPFSARELLARVRAQIRISRSRMHVEEQLRNLFMQAPVAMGIFKGPDFRIEVANENMLAIWDRRAEEVLNKPQFEAVPEIRHQGFEELFVHVYTTGERYVSPESLAIIRRRGQLEQVYVKFVFEALHEEDGEISGIMVVAHEITDLVVSRKSAEMASERLRLAIEVAAMGTFDWDLINLEFAFSPRLAEIFGFDHTQGVTHGDLIDVIRPEDRLVRERAHEEALRTGVLFYEARLIWRDGTVHWIRTDGKVLYSEQHIPIRILGTVVDITSQKMETEIMERKVAERTEELREANQLLENSNRELEQFAYIASHDLQEPLRKIQTFSELLNRSIEGNPDAQRYSDKIYTSAQRMSTLIQAVLNYSRLSRSGDEFDEVNLNDVLDNVRTDFELLMEEKSAVIKSDKLPVVRGIALQLHQLFSNLVGNALKFTDNPPMITITATPLTSFKDFPGLDPMRRYVRLTFADQGIGFDPRYAEQIFTIFQRLDHKRYSGTGIGLALCKRIVDNHNGAITATSEPDKGAIFTVCLPVE